MTPGLLFPAGLLALAALVLPILIHLSRRTEERVTTFAALRWLEARVPPRSRIRLTEWLLLALRLLLLAALALMLARPFADGWRWSAAPRVLVHPAVSPGAARALLREPPQDASWHWLAPQFPPLAQPAPAAPVAAASLLREVDALLPAGAPLVVIVPEVLAGLDGARIALGRAVDWRVAPGAVADSPTAVGTPAISFAVRHDADGHEAARYLAAAAAAWNVRTPNAVRADVAALHEPLREGTQWLAWLGGPLSPEAGRWIEAGGVALIVDAAPGADSAPAWRSDDGSALAWSEPSGQGRLLRLAAPIAPRTLPALLDADFPDRLRSLFQGPAAAPASARAQRVAPVRAASAPTPLRRTLDEWVALAIAVLFALERLVATRVGRNHGP